MMSRTTAPPAPGQPRPAALAVRTTTAAQKTAAPTVTQAATCRPVTKALFEAWTSSVRAGLVGVAARSAAAKDRRASGR